MNRMLAVSSVAVALTAGLLAGCEKHEPTPPTVPPAPKTVQGAAIDGSSDVKPAAPAAATPEAKAAAPAVTADASTPAPAPAAVATAAPLASTPKDGGPTKPVTAEELKAATPKAPASAAAAPGPEAGAEHESYQALLAQRAQTMDKPGKAIPGYEGVAFSELTSFGYMPKAPTRADALQPKLESETPLAEDEQIPANIKKLDNQKVALQGYMIPVDFEAGGTNDFLFVQVVPSCYFCQQPQPNEWIEVKTKDGKRIPYNGDDAMIITGTLDVGAKYKGGYFLSLYRMEADGVHTP